VEEVLIELGDSTGYKRIVLRLRWVTIIVTSYIILLGRGISVPQILPSLLIPLYLLSNVIAYFLLFFKNPFLLHRSPLRSLLHEQRGSTIRFEAKYFFWDYSSSSQGN
jgi:hypothetical protein